MFIAQPRDDERFWYPAEIDEELSLSFPPEIEERMLAIVRAIKRRARKWKID